MKPLPILPVLSLLFTLLLSAHQGVQAQAGFDHSLGGKLSYAFEDEAMGIGVISESRIRPIPVALVVGADYYFPRCGAVGCSLAQLHAEARVDVGRLLPFDPFIGVGMNYRRFSVRGAESAKESGVTVLGGIWRGSTFLQGRYEMMELEPDQLVVSIGFLF